MYQCSSDSGVTLRDPECDESAVGLCHTLAYCVMPKGVAKCSCPIGMYGNGIGVENLATAAGCSSAAYAVRLVINLPGVTASRVENHLFKDGEWWNTERSKFADLFFADGAPSHVVSSLQHEIFEEIPGEFQATFNVLFPTKDTARDGVDFFNTAIGTSTAEMLLFDSPINQQTTNGWRLDQQKVVWGPRVYRWTLGTTGDGLTIMPTGMTVDTVYFDTSCLASGCWVVDITYTTGEDNFNVFYLPKTDNSPLDAINADADGPWHDTEPVDFNYDSMAETDTQQLPWNKWERPPGSTFAPSSFPCGSNAYNYNADSQLAISACCLEEFIEMYRPVESFMAQVTTDAGVMDIYEVCDEPDGIISFNAPGGAVAGYYEMPSSDTEYSLFGTFAGMELSNIQPIGRSYVDPQILQYRARLRLDEVELRRFAGQFSGTVGVEHTVDTFIGISNFKPTGSAALDSAAMQVNIHLEKTDYFAVSSHGVNDYTFLDYVNMRLVEVLKADDALGESGSDMNSVTNRTSRVDPAHFVQVTFTMGSKYEPMFPGTPQAELIPLDSVRVSKGGDFEEEETQDTLFDACLEYNAPTSSENVVFDADSKAVFDSRLNDQSCAPDADMCVSPATIPDSFVSFNIPLGIDWLPEEDNSLANNVFVHLVVTAEDKIARGSGMSPNSGSAPWQMKTTLFASIPVVQGGRQIFCDAITAKTDLQDVVNATLMFGSGNGQDELTRLRIFEDIGSSVLEPREGVDFGQTASIEAGLMTLILTGEPSYFEQDGTSDFGVQLEDVITVHIMEQEPSMDAEGTVSKAVQDLLAEPGQDNYDSLASNAELRTRGYNLNGAFRFTVDRTNGQASLQPTAGLLALCPFNPPRPRQQDNFPTTCVTRRDVEGRNNYPIRTGSSAPSATEVVSTNAAVAGNRGFMQTILGESDYGAQLGEDFSRAIAARWSLNDRYNRAFWINPGYEWTPTQTGGTPRFSVSQKLFFFALVALDESLGSSARRRHLLAGSTEQGTGVSSTLVGFRTDPATLVAELLMIPPEQVTKWEVTVQLTREQACMDRGEMRAQVRDQLEAGFKASASNVLNVQIVYAVVDMASEACFGLVVRRATDQKSTATAVFDVLVAFGKSSATINPKTLMEQPGITKFNGVGLPEVIVLDDDFNVDPLSYTPVPEEDDSPLGLDWTVIYGIIGAVGGVVLLLLMCGVRYCQRGRCAKLREAQEAEIVTVMYLRDVKADLADDMFGQSRTGSQEEVDEKLQYSEFEGAAVQGGRHSNDFENAFSSPSKESRADIF